MIIDITFQRPLFLWFLLSIPLLMVSHFVFLKHTKKKGIKFANFQALKRITGESILTKNISILLLRAGIILCLILAVSGMVLWVYGFSNTNDFVIAMDVSASMVAEDIEPTRLEAAKEITLEFIDSMDSRTSFGLVKFAGVPMVEQELTTNKNKIKEKLEKLNTMNSGGTNIEGAIITATNLLVNSDKHKVILLFTDGSTTVGSFSFDSVNEAINYVNEKHVVIHTIGLGSESGPIGYLPEYYNISSVYDKENLITIANQTGGNFYEAQNREELADIYNEFISQKGKAWLDFDLSYGFLILGLLLLFIEWGLINTKFRFIP